MTTKRFYDGRLQVCTGYPAQKTVLYSNSNATKKYRKKFAKIRKIPACAIPVFNEFLQKVGADSRQRRI